MTQAFRVALHIPTLDPTQGEAVLTETSGDLYKSKWAVIASGDPFPPKTKQGQVLQTGAAPGFDWFAGMLDQGIYGGVPGTDIQFLRKINGFGAPAANEGLAGEIAIAFPDAPGATTTPQVFAHDGGAWRHANPGFSYARVGIQLGTGASIGAAWTAYTPKPPLNDVVFAQFNALPYVKTGFGTVDADWLVLDDPNIDCGEI